MQGHAHPRSRWLLAHVAYALTRYLHEPDARRAPEKRNERGEKVRDHMRQAKQAEAVVQVLLFTNNQEGSGVCYQSAERKLKC